VLSYVASACAKYDTDLIVTNRNSAIYPITEGIVRQAYIELGKPDAYKPDNVRFISEEQFGYTSGTTAIMLREKPAANLLIGAWWAEILVLAEMGNMQGSIQIAGTANTPQIPFMVAACDYSLIGEELYAASAYLSKDPILMGNLIAVDWGKMVCIGVIGLGALLVTFGNTALTTLLRR
jgi:hypothetical protein